MFLVCFGLFFPQEFCFYLINSQQLKATPEFEPETHMLDKRTDLWKLFCPVTDVPWYIHTIVDENAKRNPLAFWFFFSPPFCKINTDDKLCVGCGVGVEVRTLVQGHVAKKEAKQDSCLRPSWLSGSLQLDLCPSCLFIRNKGGAVWKLDFSRRKINI